MKILYVTMEWPTPSETFCVRDINCLIRKGHDVHVVSLKPKRKDFLSLSQKLNVHKHVTSDAISHSDYFRNVISALGQPASLARLLKHCFHENGIEILKSILLIPVFFWAVERIKKNNPDIVHLFWGHYPSFVAILLTQQKSNIPYTMFLGAYDLEKNLNISKHAAQKSTHIFTHAMANTKDLIARGYDLNQISIVYRGLDLNELNRIQPPQRQNKNICFVGRLIKDKGVDLLLHTLPLILKQHNDVHLDIIGDGPERYALENLTANLNLQSHVTFHGFIPPSDVYKYLYQSGMLILPSRSSGERLPNVIKEAMYTGAIPITSPSKGIEELVQHNETGIILDDLSPQALSNAVTNLLIQPELMEAMSAQGRAIIIKSFDVDQNMNAYIFKWQKILGNS